MRRKTSKPIIGITLGDVAGIGPEVVRKALKSRKLDRRFEYEVILESSAPHVRMGKINDEASLFAMGCLMVGVTRAMSGDYAALVTGPVNKSGLKRVGFAYPGQTEFLAAMTRTREFAMMLSGDRLKVVLVTIHEPIRKVSDLLTPDGIGRVIKLTSSFLHKSGIAHPRIAVAGLNPHAGEFGDEERKIIAPAIKSVARNCRSDQISGPHSPDAIFYRAAQGEYDAVVCMYHDQGLIPLKLLCFDSGVNTTLGLPFIRTSPDHGTAYDIAGRGMANPSSMIAAINFAAQCASGAKRR